jgi:hypothetical protein
MEEDLKDMMYGFGDEWPPDSRSVDIMRTLVIEYVTDLAGRVRNIHALLWLF